MQLVNVSGTHLLEHRTFASKCGRHVFYRGALPGADLSGMDAILLGQFRQRHLLADRFKCNLGLELRRVVLSCLHFGSLLSSCDPS